MTQGSQALSLAEPRAELAAGATDLAEASRLGAALVAAVDPLAEIRYRCQLGRDEYDRGRSAGIEEGRRAYAAEEAEQRRQAAGLVRALTVQGDVERRRWELRGEPRTRETFGQAHPDDFPGGDAAWPM